MKIQYCSDLVASLKLALKKVVCAIVVSYTEMTLHNPEELCNIKISI